MNDLFKKIKKLPPKFQDGIFSNTFIVANNGFFDANDFTSEQMDKIQELIRNVYVADIKLDDFISGMQGLKLGRKAKQITLDAIAIFFLPFDQYLSDDVSQKIKDLGGDLEKLNIKAKEFNEKLDLELHPPEIKEEPIAEEVEEKVAELPPEQEKKNIKEIFENAVLPILGTEDEELKAFYNLRIIEYIVEDPAFLQEILRNLLNNTEVLTDEKMVISEKKYEGTISAWILDFTNTVGSGKVDNLAIAKYFSEGANVRALPPEKKSLVHKALDLYKVLKEFPEPFAKLPEEEWYIFPIDYEKLKQQVDKSVQEKYKNIDLKKNGNLSKEAQITEEKKEETDLMKIFWGDSKFNEKVDLEIAKITDLTRNEYDRVGEMLENYLLKKDKIGVAASLKVLANIGVLTDILGLDKRFMDLLTNYYRKINRFSEADNLRLSPKSPHQLINFLKYILLARLQMTDQEAGRIVAQLCNILARQGKSEYSDMAYLDIKDKMFHWKF